MIDQDKMRALAIKVGAVEWYEAGDSVCLPDGDTIACCQSSIGHMPEPIHYDDMVEYLVSVSPAKILKLIDALEAAEREKEKLRAELESAAADKRDGHRYRELLGLLLAGDIPMSESSVSLNVCGVPPNQDEFDEAVDFLLAQRQGEGS